MTNENIEQLNLAAKPLAAQGLNSYRCKQPFGWVMIGAKDDDDALVQARRSHAEAKFEDLQRWDGNAYVPCQGDGKQKEVAGVANAIKSSQDCAREYLLGEYASYAGCVPEPMPMDDWASRSLRPDIARAHAVAGGGSSIGKIWWCADNMDEALQWQADLTAKGAQVELKPEDDRPIVDVIITLDCGRANEILGYEVGVEEWLDEDNDQCESFPQARSFVEFKRDHAARIGELAAELDDPSDDVFWDLIDEMKGVLASLAANEAGPGAEDQENAIAQAEAWVADNCSGGGADELVAMALWLRGDKEGEAFLRSFSSNASAPSQRN